MPTRFKLLTIPDIKVEWEIFHKMRALETNGICKVNLYLEQLKSRNTTEYRKVLKLFKLCGANERLFNPNYIKPHKKHTGIYELKIKTGFSRISFFYYKNSLSYIICISAYWKEKDYKQKEQDLFFERSAEIMEIFLSTEHTGGNK